MNEKLHKLILSGLGLLVSLVLISASTFAWFAISDAPEVLGIQVSVESVSGILPFEFSIDGENDWSTLVDLTSMLDDNNVLRPISTYDGENWFIPAYNALGDISGFSCITPAMVSSYANTGNSETNYFVYTDLYVRTVNSSEDTFTLTLSNPLATSDLQSETNYGTYVLPVPAMSTTGALLLDDAMTVFRVGFQVYDADGEKEGPFYVYEPNATARSSDLITLAGNSDTMSSQVTYVYEQGETTATTAVNYDDKYEDDTAYATQVPIVADNVLGFEMVTVGSDDTQVVSIQQGESSWNTSALSGVTGYNSSYIQTIGAFLEDTPVMTTITKGEVKQIRIYFWLEGQDIDCWNQILEGSIFANLEFTGSAVPEEEAEYEDENPILQ